MSYRIILTMGFSFIAALILPNAVWAQSRSLPTEPVEIGTTPQFVFDGYIVDNHYALKYKQQAMERVFHAPKKHAKNPLIAEEGGYVTVRRDAETGRFLMWYQTHTPRLNAEGKHIGSEYAIAYAESEDGLSWNRPKLGLLNWKGNKENNIVWKGITGKRASGQCIIDVPEADRKGYRYLMSYHTGGAGKGMSGIRVVGSQDGIYWDKSSDSLLVELHSDTLNSIVYDPVEKQYVMYCRAKHISRTFKGDILDTGASRRVARMTGLSLWSEWTSEPQTILVPDELDSTKRFHFFYGMPVRYHAGIFWGSLWPFKMNTDVVTELAFSRDGVQFERLSSRPQLLALGEEGSWDDGMVFGNNWVEVGDEWWFYYSGFDGPHGITERKPGLGVATMKKERLISLRGPRNGGVVITRKIKWPGGKLVLNANAKGGELKVRLSDAKRKVLDGFDYDDCVAVNSDSLNHEVVWNENSIESLKGQTIRLEIYLKDADLFTFRAGDVASN
ncbi:MAG: hypothetical protein K0U86_11220 [Planctomycetes bacterium]|nr:hypothetical protein [Planctomycetota bacterium]MCH9725452.1 hypothetical protein [Planctomycetota bacterium]MCH9776549.1 hypothetical protein [Planctomycetota bacterium]MCH9789564.1 hypothetical protein [Planctomycetota bacterium]